MRFGLADAGDSLEDANFTTEGADAAILKLYTQIKWTEETLAAINELRDGEPSSFDDRVFASLINKCIQETDHHYER
jgi:leucyl-tRNA synthetase